LAVFGERRNGDPDHLRSRHTITFCERVEPIDQISRHRCAYDLLVVLDSLISLHAFMMILSIRTGKQKQREFSKNKRILCKKTGL
jgi:hypothetical protein